MIPLGIIAAARTAGGGGHQYWRWTYIMVPGSYFEISELRLIDAAGVVPATISSSSSPGFDSSGNLVDGNLSSRCWWDVATVSDPSFWIMADTGTPKEVTGMQMASYDNSSRWPTNIMLSWADSPSGPWNQFLVVTNQPYPGNNSWAGVVEVSETPGAVALLIPSGSEPWVSSAGSPGYDFYLGSGAGSDGTEPSFTPPSTMVFGGGGYCTGVGPTPDFVKGMHKAGAEFTIEAWWYYNGGGSNVHPIFDSGTSDQSGTDTSRGVIFGDMGVIAPPAPGRFGFRVKRDSGAGTSFSVHLTTSLTTGWHHLAVSYQQGAGSFLWVDGAPASTNLGTTWDGTLSSPGTADPVNPMRIGARGDAAFKAATGSKLDLLRIYDRALTTGELAQNWEYRRYSYPTGGGSGHRYWRWTGFAWSGDRVDISELRVVNGSTPIAADMTSSSPPSYNELYYLTNGSFGASCTWWNPAGLWIVADLGSAQEVTGMQVGSAGNPGEYPTDVTLQWSDDNSSWTTFGTWSGLTYPGNYTAGPVLTP